MPRSASNDSSPYIPTRGGKNGYEIPFLPPQSFKPCLIGSCIPDGVLNIPMAEVILNQPRVRPLIGQGKAARMPQHVRMGGKGKPGELAIAPDQHPRHLSAERRPPFGNKERLPLWPHALPFGEPRSQYPEFVTPERVRRREPTL